MSDSFPLVPTQTPCTLHPVTLCSTDCTSLEHCLAPCRHCCMPFLASYPCLSPSFPWGLCWAHSIPCARQLCSCTGTVILCF